MTIAHIDHADTGHRPPPVQHSAPVQHVDSPAPAQPDTGHKCPAGAARRQRPAG